MHNGTSSRPSLSAGGCPHEEMKHLATRPNIGDGPIIDDDLVTRTNPT
jgi:hypothetical protein